MATPVRLPNLFTIFWQAKTRYSIAELKYAVKNTVKITVANLDNGLTPSPNEGLTDVFIYLKNLNFS